MSFVLSSCGVGNECVPFTPMTTLRVLFFVSDISLQSGASYALCETVNRLCRCGVEPTVVLPDTAQSRSMFAKIPCECVYLNIRRPRLSLNPMIQVPYLLSLIPMLVRLRRIARRRSIDLIHYNECLDFAAGLVARSCRLPVVCHVRADGWPVWVQYVLRGALRLFADIIIVPSNSTAEWIRNRGGKLATRVRVVPDHAFDIAPYDPTLPRNTFREELRMSEDAPLIIMVAKLQPDKGHPQFIRMAEIVHEHNKSAQFVIIGGPVEGHMEEAQDIARLGASAVKQGYLHMVGPRQDLPSVFSACDVFMHCPTYPDPYPTVVLLAMLMGKTAICSGTGGIVEQIEDDVTGILVPPGSAGAMASAVLDLIASPSRRRELGQAAMLKARSLYDPNGQAKSIRHEYEALVR